MKAKILVGVLGLIIPKGNYICYVKGLDEVNNNAFREHIFDMDIKSFKEHSMMIIDIQPASNIVQGSENTTSIFYKNIYEVAPVPTATFDENQPVLFYYTELYGNNQDNLLKLKE